MRACQTWLTRRRSRRAEVLTSGGQGPKRADLLSVLEAGRTGLAPFVLGGLDRTPGELGEGFVCRPSLVGVSLGDSFPGDLHRGVEGGIYLVGPGGLVLDEQNAWGRLPYRVGDFVLLRAALMVADASDRASQLWHAGILPSVWLYLLQRRSTQTRLG